MAPTTNDDPPLLSVRGKDSASFVDFLTNYMIASSNNPFCPKTNPSGIVNMGTAVSRLMEKELQEYIIKNNSLSYSSEYQHYFNFCGTDELRNGTADLLTRHLCPENPIDPSLMVFMNGVTSCLDALGHTLCDPGDVMITPTPCYGRIFTDFTDRSRVKVEPLHLSERNAKNGETFYLDPSALDARITELKSQGSNVRAFIVLHPHNPLGDVYSAVQLRNLMEVCAKHKVHFISDEIYALSVFDEDTIMPSAFAIKDLPDPERTHILWGFSKDLGLAGFRLGVIHSRNAEVLNCLNTVGSYQATSHVTMHAAATLINDKEWFDKFYLPTNKQKLRKAYDRACSKLEQMGVGVRKSKAAFFIWANVQSFMKSKTEEEEMAIFDELFEAGLYVVPGVKNHCQDPGWIRIVFTVSEEEIDVGLDRMENVLKKRKL